jgi:phosphate transport system protein
LGQIDKGLTLGLALVEEAVAGAREAFLTGDDGAVIIVATRRQEIRSLHDSLESLVFTQLVRQAPVAGELRHLVAVLRIVPELDLTAALTGDIACRGAVHLGPDLPPGVRGLVTLLFERVMSMWHLVSDSYGARTPHVHERLHHQAAEMAELHTGLMAELVSGRLRPPVLVDMALVARFLERLGDHAVEVGRWIESFTSFEPSPSRTTERAITA